MTNNRYTYSEIFNSIQGEGVYTGRMTAWLRYFACNLQCNGFGQKDPTDPSSYILPYENIDLNETDKFGQKVIDSVEDLPVFDKGCDSSYSWAAKFKHLQHKHTVKEIADNIRASITTLHNPLGSFIHPETFQDIHMCFTGGEPLRPPTQKCTTEILRYFLLMSNSPRFITFETNGTQSLTPGFVDFFHNRGLFSGELFFSVSPKLFTVSGEHPERAIKPERVKEYFILSQAGQLKFVVDGTDRCWDELDRTVKIFRDHGVMYPVYVMPVGSTVEDQEQTAGDIASMAIDRGYNVSARVHTYLFGNQIGT